MYSCERGCFNKSVGLDHKNGTRKFAVSSASGSVLLSEVFLSRVVCPFHTVQQI